MASMNEDGLTVLLTAIVKQYGGEIFLPEEALDNVDGGVAVAEDLINRRWSIKYVSAEEAMALLEEQEDD